MIIVDSIYTTIKAIASKEGGVFSAGDFNKYAPMASIDLFNYYFGSPKQYRQKALPVVAYPKTQTISENLKHLMVADAELTVVNGRADIPEDLCRVDAVSCDTGPVVRKENNEWETAKKSSSFGPTLEYPIYRELSAELEFLPVNISNPKLTYLKYPAVPKWAYTLSGTKPVYSEADSANFDWPETERLNLITRILSYLGIQLREGELTQYAEAKQQTIS